MTSTARTARCGPARRVVWEGLGQALTAPIPIPAASAHREEGRDDQTSTDDELLGHAVAGLSLDPCVEAVDPSGER